MHPEGFSRGAYQVRALAGMIEKVRIPFLPYTAFHIYQHDSARPRFLWK